MAVTARRFTASDCEGVARLWNIVHADDKLRLRRSPARFGRFVAGVDGEVAGAAAFEQPVGMYHPQKLYLDVHVHPDVEGGGIGCALYEQVLRSVAPFDPVALRGQVRESHERACAFVQKLGFVEDKRD